MDGWPAGYGVWVFWEWKFMVQNEKPPLMRYPWPRWVEPWYLAYALLGATAAGMVPILLPLAVSRISGASHIGLVMAAFNLGGLTAPLWGSLADRHRLHRWMLSGGLLATAIGLAAIPFALRPFYRCLAD